ncbi:hypothetical protein [Anaerotignum sp.]|uniref:hypothetical protein n=1 Tax=Anaerotignum sp. TaxID=2039241 RepID=UPI002896AB9C|nr:hypothetical protein [Anaerotignum sp.]
MLGILLAVLKFIGILLLSIFLLLIFLVAVILLCPIKYRLAGEKKETLMGDFAVSWLFGLIRIMGNYLYGTEPEIKVKILWFTLGEKRKKKKIRKRKTKPSTQPIKTGETVVARESVSSKKSSSQGVYMAEPTPTPKREEAPISAVEPPTNTTTPVEEIIKEDPPNSRPKVRRVKISEIKEKPILFETENKEFFLDEEDLSEEDVSKMDKLRSYWDKFQEIEGKGEIFQSVKKLLKRLIKGILPNHLLVKATIGLGEPNYTGYFMGLVGILTAKFGKNIQVKADFTRLVAEDIEVRIKGNILFGYFLYSLMAFIMTKPVRRILIKLWKGRKQNG